MNLPNRELFERICVGIGWGIQRNPEGLFRGLYCDQKTNSAWNVLCEYEQRQQIADALGVKP